MKSKTLTLAAVITLLLAAMAGPCWLGAQEQEQQRPKTRQQYSVTDMGTAIALSAQNEQEDSNRAVKFTNLIDFDFTNGWFPLAPLVQGTDGDIYGATLVGGANTTDTTCFGGGVGCGTIFKITPGGTLTTLYNFCSQTNCADGGNPDFGLVLGTDGNFYGITGDGGANGFGTVFKITPGGTLSTLYNWCSQPNCADGNYTFLEGNPGTFVEATDGNFYGANNGPGNGTVFKLAPSGALTTLHTFGTQSGDGSLPSGLIQATDGNFYGTTYTGGTTNGGTVFKITPSGVLTTLYTFCSQPNCKDGELPFAPLIQGADGNFYGTTTEGGASSTCIGCGSGTVFKITPQGTLTTLYTFCSQTNCTDGSPLSGGGGGPLSELVEATDGNFYGPTGGGGDSSGPCANIFGVVGCGTVFKITPGGTLTTLHSFDFIDGAGTTGVTQATDGTFYGTNPLGGPSNSFCALFGSCGTVFRLSVGLGPFVETVPSADTVGEAVTILGTDLADATHVFFNHTEAAFTVVSRTEIQTSVPAGATTGFVTVTRQGPLLKSNVKFHVLP